MQTYDDLRFDQDSGAPPPRRRRVLLAVLLALAVGVLALVAVVGLRGAEPPAPAQAAAAPAVQEPPTADDAGTDGQGSTDPQGDGQGDQGGEDGQDGGQPSEPDPAELVVGPDPVTLGWGVYSGSFTVANAGDEAMQWTAASKPSVTLSDSGGELTGDEEQVVSFTIDDETLEPGSFSFKIKVMGAGETVYVDVKGIKPIEGIKS